GGEAKACLGESKTAYGCFFKGIGLAVVISNHNDLYGVLEKMQNCDSVGRSEDSELFGYTGKGFDRLLCLVAISLVRGVVVQPHQRDGSHGISCRSGGIL